MTRNILFLLIVVSVQNSRAGFWGDRLDELASPFTTDAKYFLLAGSATTALFALDTVEDTLGHDVQNETVENKPLGSLSAIGDYAGQTIPNAIYAGVMYGLYKYFGDEAYYKKSVLMFKASLYSGVVANGLKAIVREPRPNVRSSRESFPSGHTTTAFAFASVVGTQHEWYWAVPAYGLATMVAFSRINDNKHWLHDVIGGAVLGTTYGLSLTYLAQEKEKSNISYFVSPLGNDGLYGSFAMEF